MRRLKDVWPEFADEVAFYTIGVDPTESLDRLESYKENQGYPWPMAIPSPRMLSDFRVIQQSTKVAIGGNGGVHACGLAEDLGVARIVVPPTAGLFSALGLLLADVEHQAVSALYRPLDAIVPDEVNGVLTPLLAEVERLLAADGFAGADARRIEVLADTKYVGQTWTLAIALEGVPVTDATLDALKSAFGDAHERAYHYRSDAEPVQLVALKVVGRGLAQSRDVALKPGERARAGPNETRDAFFGEDPGWLPCAVVGRGELGAEARPGPLIVEDYDSTIVVRPGWGARRDGAGNVDLAWGEDGQAWRAERTT